MLDFTSHRLVALDAATSTKGIVEVLAYLRTSNARVQEILDAIGCVVSKFQSESLISICEESTYDENERCVLPFSYLLCFGKEQMIL
jgi:hypothetical protein